MQEPSRLTATEAARLMRDGRLRPADLMDSCLARIAEREGAVRAFACFDPAAARRGGAAAPPGKLHGLPIGVKDVLDTADMLSEYGSPIWRGWQPRADAAAVAWARAAGAVVVGKTVTTEFATRKPGPTGNPHNLKHTPGGSSSGSAAGVADGFFPLAYGTQTAGSVLRPAAYCGVVGYKPTFGMINRHGMKLMSESLDTVGVIARSVADCALFAGAVAGRDLGNPDARPQRTPRIGICCSPAWDKALPETRALLSRVASAVGRAGASVVDRELSPGVAAVAEAHPIVMNNESGRALGWELANARDQISEGLRERLEFGLSQNEAAVAEAHAVFDCAQREFPNCMEGLDALVTPSAPGQAPAGLEWTGDPVFNLIWTSLHVPCVTVPAGTGPDGLPLGIQIVTRIGEDREALAWAQWVAAAIG
ncbi:MAG TPA: amidase [Acetobacteraceae bacterium]|jgi:Asp-tRNA(Asn)/Glu-tRNA(Gln) amidotransferase A subunit family amidase|nr:amidase [Acetobacteraceae bacterium]